MYVIDKGIDCNIATFMLASNPKYVETIENILPTRTLVRLLYMFQRHDGSIYNRKYLVADTPCCTLLAHDLVTKCSPQIDCRFERYWDPPAPEQPVGDYVPVPLLDNVEDPFLFFLMLHLMEG